jgi:hypothetical protein
MKHYRMTITELMLQDEWWQCQDGMPIRLVEMEPSHRFNTLAWLWRRARVLYRHYLWHMKTTAPANALPAVLAYEVSEAPEKWLGRQPLIVELVRLCKLDDSIDGEVVEGHVELMEQLALPPSDMTISLEARNKS